MQGEAPLSDPVTNHSDTGCLAMVTGNGAKFKSPEAALKLLDGMLKDEGCLDTRNLRPTSIGAGYRKGDQICLANAGWIPEGSANCLQDQPISACPLKLEQQLYTVTLNCGVETSAE